MKLRSIHLAALLLIVTVVASGCGLFGSGVGNNTGSKVEQSEVMSTIDALTEAGLDQQVNGIAQYMTSSVMMDVLNDADDSISQKLQGDKEIIDRLHSVLEDSTITDIRTDIGEINVYDGRSEMVGSFEIELINSFGQLVECSGYATATLVNNEGIWQISTVAIEENTCLIDGEEPGDGDGSDGDDETGDPDPDPSEGDDDIVDPSEGGVPNITLSSCEYLIQGSNSNTNQIMAIQTSLNYLGYSAGLVDGDYGPITVAAVSAFQRDAGIYVDGEFGAETQRALDLALQSHGGAFYCRTVEEKPTSNTRLTMSALRRGTAFETPVYIYDGAVSGPTIAFVGCIHGNERSGHLTLVDAINKGITIDRGRLILVPAINKLACDQNRRTLSRSGSVLSGKDFNRFFPVGSTPSYTIAREMWTLLGQQRDLAFVVDFHDGFINSLGNTLLHTRQTRAQSVARKIRDSLNRIRPSGARGPVWRAFSEPISGSLIRKVGRDMGVPGILVELSGRNPGDPLSLRKTYAERIIKMVGEDFGMTIRF